MRASVVFAVAAAGYASAQTTACDAQNIVDSCLATTSIPLDACAPNDWQCMCDAQTSVVTCYNNCPGDQNRFAAEQQQTAWCNAAAQFAPTSTSRTATLATSTSASAAATSDSAASESASASASASSTSQANAAAGLAAPVTGLFAVAFGFLGLL